MLVKGAPDDHEIAQTVTRGRIQRSYTWYDIFYFILNNIILQYKFNVCIKSISSL